MKKILVALLVLTVLAIPVIKKTGKIVLAGDPWDCAMTMFDMNR